MPDETIYCACCGTFRPEDVRSYDHCGCKTCQGSPNYCTRCGKFIGNHEYQIRHARAGCAPAQEEVTHA
jgi:hypothetical protein